MNTVVGEEVLIVGRNSYIGGYLSQYAKRRGLDVTAIGSAECNFLNLKEVAEFFSARAARPHTVVFLAVVNKSVENSFKSYRDNVSIVRHFIDGCRRVDVRSIVYFSSVDVYGRRPPLPITEHSPITPDTWYGLAKYTCEWMLRSSGEVRCPVTILRIPGVYGRWDGDRSVIGRMVGAARKEGRIVVRGSGERLRDYVYVDDVARLVEALNPLKYDGVLNVATGVSRSVLEMARLVCRVLGRQVEIVHEAPDEEREFDLSFDNRALTAVLPGFQFSGLEVGIQTYL